MTRMIVESGEQGASGCLIKFGHPTRLGTAGNGPWGSGEATVSA